MSQEKDAIEKKLVSFTSALANAKTRTQFDTILAGASSIISKALDLGINFKITENLDAGVKGQEIDQIFDRIREDEEKFREELLKKALINYRAEIESRKESLSKLSSQANQNIEKDIKRIDAEIHKIEELTVEFSKITKDKIATPEEISTFDKKLSDEILKLEEIEARFKDHQKIYEDRDNIHNEHKVIHDELEKLKLEVKELHEKLMKNDLHPTEAKRLKDDLDFSKEKLEAHTSLATLVSEIKSNHDEKLAKYEEQIKLKGEAIESFGQHIDEHHQKDPEKYHSIKQKHELLVNQHKAIITDGKVADAPVRENVINKRIADQANQAASTMRNNMTPSSGITPNTTPNNKQPGPNIGR